MKKRIIYSLIVLFTISIIQSCDDKAYLDTKPLTQYSEIDVFSDINLAETFLNTAYRGALGFPFNYLRLSGTTDEALYALFGNLFNFNKSLVTSDGLTEWWDGAIGIGWGAEHTRHLTWNPLFANIRKADLFLSKTKNTPATDKGWNRLKGEAHFLRAYTYHLLVSLYGGVPIIKEPATLNDDLQVPRNTYEECIKFIVEDLDLAATLLPLPANQSATQIGRATAGAALALKARVLLFAASDLHNPEKNTSITTGFAHPELLGYTTAKTQERWTLAQNAAKDLMNRGYYDLYKKNPSTSDNIVNNISNYFISYSSTEEDILLQYFPKIEQDGYTQGLRVAPNGYNGHGANTPLPELVDDYEMKDGSKFDWNNPAQKASPYANRDARFYATILYEGASWVARPNNTKSEDPFNKIQVGSVFKLDGTTRLKGGLDTQFGSTNTANAGKTGYYLRKAVDPAIKFEYEVQTVPFRHFRYAEVLMNYAEACIELGQEGEARNYINMIRKRAGQPELSSAVSGVALKEAYRHERRIEFAFEEFRHWDVRRWMIAPQITHQMKAMDIKYLTDGNATTYLKSDGTTWSDPVYAEVNNSMDVRVWNNKMYFFPILRDEMNKNKNLIQNPGY
jgi:hypothetical protein